MSVMEEFNESDEIGEKKLEMDQTRNGGSSWGHRTKKSREKT